ncbi:MAG: hypothetical protein K0U53_04235, partial [Betaproteobacteria bacterium]|nr:hypothetical protein [Betaproteobacteria bacterium]
STLGEFFRQYFFAMDREELPFNRAQRDWVEHAANGEGNTIAFGSTRNLGVPGTAIFTNAPFPPLDDQFASSEPMMIGPRAREPYITLDDTVLDPVAARVDLAIRIGDPGDDPRLARKLFETRGVVCCGPEQADLIKDATDLDGLLWLRTPTMPRKMPLYAEDGRERVIAPDRQLVVNSAPMIRAVLAEGGGFAIFPEFSVRDALADKTLCNPLPDFATATVPAYALFTERRTELTIARAFVDALVKGLVQGP